MNITGTFIDEISHDIPSANWGRKEWERDFKVMKKIGIDTVILIRSGYKDKMTFTSKTLIKHFKMRPAYVDLIDLFLELSEIYGMKFFFGLYDSGKYWHEGDYLKELFINKELAEEVIVRYGHRRAFGGWYASHEICDFDSQQINMIKNLCIHLRHVKNIPVVISPYIKGKKQFGTTIDLEEHKNNWEKIFSFLSGTVDYVAFQDGQVDFNELEEFSIINKELALKYNITSWVNIESFERGMPINFLPIDWRNLKYKLDIAERVGFEKAITFEFSHFMSPNSMYPSAHKLFERYIEQTVDNGHYS